MRAIGLFLTLIGGILMGVDGIIYFVGSPASALLGITGLVLGLGLILFTVAALPQKQEAKS